MRSSERWRAAAGTVDADEELLTLVRDSIAHGLRHGTPLPVDAASIAPTLNRPCACFVTLRRAGELRGCVGTLEARAPLAVSAVDAAFRAAFEDPRFEPLREDELRVVEVHVSILSAREPLATRSEEELLRALRPGVDGLVLHTGAASATFLPAVWDQLPEPTAFVRALKRKIDLPEHAWGPDWRWERFTAREVG